jgi:phage antirepressor YoqD-like protein
MTALELALTESRTLRDEHMGRTEALDAVKSLTMLPGDTYLTVDMVATYYEVPVDAVESHIRRDRDELVGDGLEVLTGSRLSAFKTESGYTSRAGSLTLIPRRAILRLGMLLRDSRIAQQVRTYLLDSEQNRQPALPTSFAEALQLAADQARELEQKNAVIAVMEPKAAQADHHRAADGLMLVGDFANQLKAWAKREHNVRILHEQVWDFLADIGLLIRGNTVRHNQPTAFATERDFVRAKFTEYQRSDGELESSCTPRLTPAGEGWAWDRAVKRIAAHGSLTAPVKAIEGASA